MTGSEIGHSFYLIHLFVLLAYVEWQKTRMAYQLTTKPLNIWNYP